MSRVSDDVDSDVLPVSLRLLSYEPDLSTVKVWLSRLVVTNAQKSCESYLVFLAESNNCLINPSHRLKILEHLQPSLLTVSSSLYLQFIDSGLPLATNPRKIARLVLRCLEELARGYKLIANDVADFKSCSLTHFEQALSLIRVLQTSCAMFKRKSQIYEPVFPGYWSDLYRVFAISEQLELTKKQFENGNETTQIPASVEDVFKSILLFSLSNPNRYRQRKQALVFRLVSRFTGSTEIGKWPVVEGRKALFFIDLNSDSAPQHISRLVPNGTLNPRFIFTRRTVEEIVENIQRSSNIEKNDSYSPSTNATVFSVARNLGAPKKRKTTRSPENEDRALMVGLDAVVESIQHSKKFLQRLKSHGLTNQAIESAGSGGIEQSHLRDNSEAKNALETNRTNQYKEFERCFKLAKAMTAPKFDLLPLDDYKRHLNIDERSRGKNDHSDEIAMQIDPSIDRVKAEEIWGQSQTLNESAQIQERSTPANGSKAKLLNSSAYGYCLAWMDPNEFKFKIGEPVGFPVGFLRFEIGVTRWIVNEEERVILGVELLSPSVDTVELASKRYAGQPDHGLLLPRVSRNDKPESILLPPHLYELGDQISLVEGKKTRNYELYRLLETTESFARFAIAESDRRKMI